MSAHKSEADRTIRAFVHGRVQKVGYRAWVNAHAQALGLRGFVRASSSGFCVLRCTAPSTRFDPAAPSVGQKLRARTEPPALLRRDDRLRLATRRGHLVETVRLASQKDDHAIAIPIAA